MTREELKEHCKKQVEHCELWAKQNGKEPQGNIYEEHKLILELLGQEPILDKIRAEVDELVVLKFSSGERIYKDEVLDIIDKYKKRSEESE